MTYDQATIKCHHRKLLTESDIGTDALPTVTESGKEEESDLDLLPDQRIQPLARSCCRWVWSLSSRFWCHQYPSSVIWWGCADFWSRQSSVYEWWRTECFSMTAEREAVYKEYRSKDWSLWNTEWDGTLLRGVAVDTKRLNVVCKVC